MSADMKKRIEEKRIEERIINEQLTLTLVELIEVLVPLAYICVTLISYNGPNHDIIGKPCWGFQLQILRSEINLIFLKLGKELL